MTEEQETLLMMRFIDFMNGRGLSAYLEKDLILDSLPFLWVSCITIWTGTKEGFDYWVEAENEWKKLLEELK